MTTNNEAREKKEPATFATGPHRQTQTSNNEAIEKKELATPKDKKFSLEGLAQLASNLRAVVMNLGIILLISCFIVFAYLEIKSDLLIVEPFAVPEYLSETGYTGKAVSKVLMDQISFIGSKTPTSVEQKEITGAWAKEQLQVEVPGTGLSLAHINRLLKDLFGRQTTQVVGEIVLLNEDSGDLELTVRISGNPAETFTGNIQDLKDVLLKTAEYVVKCSQPYILASYQYSPSSREQQALCLETIEYMIENDPADDDVWAYNLWGILLGEQTRWIRSKKAKAAKAKAAIEKFEMAISLQPGHPHAYTNLGKLYLNLKEYGKAIEQFQEYDKYSPENANFYLLWGQALTETEKENEADEKFNKAILLNPKIKADILLFQGKKDLEKADIFLSRGNKDLAKKEYDKAIEKFEEVVGINPNFEREDAEINFLWSRALEKKENYKESLDKIEMALKIEPENADFLIARDRVKAPLDKRKIPVYEKLLEKDPDDVVKKNDLAWIYVTLPAKEERKPDRGLTLAKEAVEAATRDNHPGLPSFLDTLAAAYAENRNFKEAVKTAREGIRKNKEYQDKYPRHRKKYKEVREKAERLLSKAYRRGKTYCQYQEEIKERASKDKGMGGYGF